MLLGTAAAAQAQPSSLNLRQPLGLGAVHHQAGVRAQAPSPQALAASVQQTAGVPLSQVTAVNVCAAPQPGHAACAAQQLVLRANHRLVHPHVKPHPTFTQVFPRRRSGVGGAGAVSLPEGSMSSTPASAPAAGTPAFLQQAYDLTYLSQTAGAGDTVAIVDVGDDLSAQGDLATYRSTYGLPPCTTGNGCFTKVNQTGGASPLPSPAGSDWEAEISLDLDAISALCPNCHILLVETNSSSISDLDAGIAAAIGLHANQVSNSWAGTSSAPVGVGSLLRRRDHRRHRRSRLSRRGRRQLSGRLPRRHGRGRHDALRRCRGHQHPRLHRVGVVAQQLRHGLGRRLGLRHPRAQAHLPGRHRMHGPFLRRCLGRCQSRHRPAGLRRGQRRVVRGRGHQPGHPAHRSLRGADRGQRRHRPVGLHQQRAAQRPRGRLNGQLRRRLSPTSATRAPATTGRRASAPSREPSSPAPPGSAARRSATAPPTATPRRWGRPPRRSSAACIPTVSTPPTTGSTAPRTPTASRPLRRTSARARRPSPPRRASPA